MISKLLSLNKKEIVLIAVFSYIIFLGFWNISLLLIIGVLILFWAFNIDINYYSFSYLDIGFLFILLSEIISYINSEYSINSFHSLSNYIILLFIYIFYKYIFIDTVKKELFKKIFLFYSMVLALLTILFFWYFRLILASVDFIELNNFKNLYNPFGIFSNIWVAIFLLLIPFNLLILNKKNKKLVFFNVLLTIACIIISFSRGAYLSLFVFVILTNIFLVSILKKKILLFNALFLLLLISSSFFVKNDVLDTISFNKTVSQKRSIDSRISQWKSVNIKSHPVLGWGQGNFILSQYSDPHPTEDKGFLLRIDNLYFQILIERGGIGLASYLLLFIIILIILYHNLKSKKVSKTNKLKVIIIFVGLTSFLIRELTFSSFYNNSVYFTTFHLIFFLIPFDTKIKTLSISSTLKKYIIFFLLTLFLFLIFKTGKTFLIKKYNTTFIDNYNKNEIDKSIKNINKAIKLSPQDIILNKHKILAATINSIHINISKDNPKLLSFININKTILLHSLNSYQKVLNKNNYDSEIYHNMGWLYFALEEKDKAKDYFDKAIQLDPYNYAFLISKLLYDIKYSFKKELISNQLSKILRYDPEILESLFYVEFSEKYPLIAINSKKLAIESLKNSTNPILKARLARLLLDSNPKKSLQLLNQITSSLPNMSRPWMYKGFLTNKLKNDSISAELFFNRSILLGHSDYLPKLYFAKYYKSKNNDNLYSVYLKNALTLYNFKTTPSFNRDSHFSSLKSVSNTYLPIELLNYIKPKIIKNPIEKPH